MTIGPAPYSGGTSSDPPTTMYYCGGTGAGNSGNPPITLLSPGDWHPGPLASPTAPSSAYVESTQFEALWPGCNWDSAHGYNAQLVPYPAAMQPFSPLYEMLFADSITVGVEVMKTMIQAWFAANSTGLLCLLGASQGAGVVDATLRDIETWPTPPPTDRLTYFTVANPSRPGGAFAHWWHPGSPLGNVVPIIEYTNPYPCPNTRYDGTYVFWQYDGGGSDWPDLVAVPTLGGSVQSFLETVAADILCPMPVINAMIGFLNIHIGLPLSGGVALEAIANPFGGPDWTIGMPVLNGPLHRPPLSAAELINVTTYPAGGTCHSYMLPNTPIVPMSFLPPVTYPLGNFLFTPLYEAMYDRAARPWGSSG